MGEELGPDGTPIVLNEGTMLPGDTKEPQCVPDLRGGTNFPPSYDPSLQFVLRYGARDLRHLHAVQTGNGAGS